MITVEAASTPIRARQRQQRRRTTWGCRRGGLWVARAVGAGKSTMQRIRSGCARLFRSRRSVGQAGRALGRKCTSESASASSCRRYPAAHGAREPETVRGVVREDLPRSDGGARPGRALRSRASGWSSFPRACGCGSTSRARSCTIRTCCSSTSRPPARIRFARAPDPRPHRAVARRAERRSSSPPTTWRRPLRSATRVGFLVGGTIPVSGRPRNR